MDLERAADEVASWVLGLTIGDGETERTIASLNGLDVVRWRTALLYQFSLAVVTAGRYENCSAATDDEQTALMAATFQRIGPALMEAQTVATGGITGLFKRLKGASAREVILEFQGVDRELRETLLEGLRGYSEQGTLPSVPLWQLRSDDPLICGIGRAVDLVLCRKMGFECGAPLAVYAHLLLLGISPDHL